MKHISQENLDLHRVEKYSKEFRLNSPFPHIVIDNFLAKDSADKVLDNFKINENNTSFKLIQNNIHPNFFILENNLNDGNIKIRGFETVRRDWCKLARNLQSEILKSILKNA